MIAHIAGLPVEELMLPLMSVGSGIALIIIRARRERPQDPG